jgi:hypothetical protein
MTSTVILVACVSISRARKSMVATTYLLLHPKNSVRRGMLVKQPNKLSTVVDDSGNLADQML